MVELYNEESYVKENKRRIKYLLVYLALFFVVLAIEITLLIYFSTRPFGTPLETPLLVVILVLGGVFTAFSVVYLTIPYGRIKSYCDILCDFLDNERVTTDATVLNFDYNLTVKYGVDFYRVELLEWSETEDDYVERSVLIDNEIKNLDFKDGDILKITTTGNMLVGYQVISRK
jgi:hypothetical protein